jgi:hypothetical protein
MHFPGMVSNLWDLGNFCENNVINNNISITVLGESNLKPVFCRSSYDQSNTRVCMILCLIVVEKITKIVLKNGGGAGIFIK